MTKIHLRTITGNSGTIKTGLTVGEWLVKNYSGTGKAWTVLHNGVDISQDIDTLCEGRSEYTVIETPAAGITVAGWLAIVSIVISVAAYALAPKPKIPATINRNQESPNNALGARSNTARPLQRVPDIKGTVKSIPDVIMPPYFKYQDLRTRVEHGYYCVGRKQLQLASIKDGDTPINLIEGASAQVYYPYNSPNSSAGPDVQIGDFIDLPIYTPYRSNEVDGIALPAIEDVGSIPILDADITGYTIGGSGASKNFRVTPFILSVDLSPDYYVGNSIVVTASPILFADSLFAPTLSEYFDVSGTHKITQIVQAFGYSTIYTDLEFTTPNEWLALGNAGRDYSMATEFSTPYNQWYYMTRAELENGFVNVTAPNGIYRDTGGTFPLALTVEFDVEVEPVDIDGNPSGVSVIYSSSLSGNNSIKRGITVEFPLPYATRFRCRVRRTTARNTSSGTIMDDIKWEDLYGLDTVELTDFGNVTTIQTRTIATPFATAVKDRQLNCIASEMLYKYEAGGTYETALTVNASAVQSYISDFTDPQLGNRPISELDADGLLTMESAIVAYFGTTEYAEFNFTLDSTDITFQDYTQMLFNALNSVAYRDGSIVRAHFERSVDNPTMLFTHRSKLPGSETYTRSFNLSQLPDGVEFKWTNPDTDTQEIIYIPADKSAVNPKKFEMAGFRNYNQAYKRAYREYNRILNEKVFIDFEATAEARYIKPGAVISVVKGTRTNTADGEVLAVSVDGYTLTLSQDVSFADTGVHSLILKLDDGTCEPAILCSPGAAANEVILDTLPSFTIRTGIDYQRRTEFSFGNDDRLSAQLYIARSIDTGPKHSVSIRAVNYTDAYYANDDANLRAFSSGFSNGFG